MARRIDLSSILIYPILTSVVALPLLLLLSLGAGWSVWKSAPVSWSEELHLQYGDGTPPYAAIELPAMSSTATYAISLVLQIPRSNANLALGNFMVGLDIMNSYNNRTMKAVRKPCLMSPNWLPSAVSRSTRLTVVLIESFLPAAPQLSGRVEVGRRDGWRSLGHGEGKELTVQHAWLEASVTPSGFRVIVARFPMATSVAATLAFFVVSTLALCTSFIPLFGLRIGKEADSSKSAAVGNRQ